MRAILFLMLLFSSCNSPGVNNNSHSQNKQSLANEVRKEAFVQLRRERELYACGIGASMMDQIKVLELSFKYYKNVDINQARELLMTAGTAFLKIINNTEQIHQFLENYPFRPQNIEITIFLQKSNGTEPDLDKLTVVSLRRGILEYEVRSSETNRLSTIYEETFEEAAAKIGFTEDLSQSSEN